MSGAQGLEAMEAGAELRLWVTTGSVRSLASAEGMGGGPCGLPTLATTARLVLGLAAETLEEAVSGAPAAIQALMTATSFSGSLSPLGGMLGSSAQVMILISLEPSGSPGSMILPPPEPVMAPWWEARLRSPFFLSGLWQLRQALRRMGRDRKSTRLNSSH